MTPLPRSLLRACGFAIGFGMVLMGGAGLAGVVFSVAQADAPPLRLVVGTLVFLGLPLAAFRAYDRARVASQDLGA